MRGRLKCLLTGVVLLSGCGGGTAGTSVTGDYTDKLFVGLVVDKDSNPIEGATVEIAASGDQGTTDSMGRVRFTASIPENMPQVIVHSAGNELSTTLPDATPFTCPFGVRLQIEGTTMLTVGGEFIPLTITGAGCDGAFAQPVSSGPADGLDANIIIHQVKPVPDGSVCTVNVLLERGGIPAAGTPFGIRAVSPDEAADPFSAPFVGQGVSDDSGHGNLQFTFNSDSIAVAYYQLEGPLNFPLAMHMPIRIQPMK